MKLIDDAKDWWRFWSMLTEEQRASILALFGVTPEQMAGIAAVAMFVSVAGARVAEQD